MARCASLSPAAGLGGLRLVLEPVCPPRGKDYDAAPGQGPAAWPETFDVARWGVLAARVGGARVGGEVVVREGGDVAPADGRPDVAVPSDLRVAPGWRRQGLGAALSAMSARDATRSAGTDR